MVEREMQHTLSYLLSQSLADFSKFDSAELEKYLNWMDQYPVHLFLLNITFL